MGAFNLNFNLHRHGQITECIYKKDINGELVEEAHESIIQSISEDNLNLSFDDILKKLKRTTISNSNTRHLLDITYATFQLVRKNKEIHLKLNELMLDAKKFLISVMENPENREVKQRLKIVV